MKLTLSHFEKLVLERILWDALSANLSDIKHAKSYNQEADCAVVVQHIRSMLAQLGPEYRPKWFTEEVDELLSSP